MIRICRRGSRRRGRILRFTASSDEELVSLSLHRATSLNTHQPPPVAFRLSTSAHFYALSPRRSFLHSSFSSRSHTPPFPPSHASFRHLPLRYSSSHRTAPHIVLPPFLSSFLRKQVPVFLSPSRVGVESERRNRRRRAERCRPAIEREVSEKKRLQPSLPLLYTEYHPCPSPSTPPSLTLPLTLILSRTNIHRPPPPSPPDFFSTLHPLRLLVAPLTFLGGESAEIWSGER